MKTSVLDGLLRSRTWKVLGWVSFFVFVTARILVPARGDGSAGLSVLGSDLLQALGRPLDVPDGGLPVAILVALLLSLPIAGFTLSSGALASQLKLQGLRLVMLRVSRTEYWVGRLLGESLLLAGLTFFATALALLNGQQRSPMLSLESTVAPTLGFALVAWSYGCVFLMSGHLMVIAGRGGGWKTVTAGLGLGLWFLLPLVLGADSLSPLGCVAGLLSQDSAALGLAVLSLIGFSGLLGGITHSLFRRLEL